MAQVADTFRHVYSASALLGLLMLTFSIAQAGFLTLDNLVNIAVQSSLIGLFTCGATLPVLTGGLDLTVGSVAALAGVVFVRLLDFGLGPAGLLALLAGAVVGALNGLLVGRCRFNSIIVTLGAMAWVEGLALWISHGYPLAGPSGSFEMLGGGFFLHVPFPIVFLVVVAAAAHILLTQTQFGRDLYAIGHSIELAAMCGVPTARRIELVYIASGMLSAFSGMVLASRLNTASPLVGQDAPLQALVAIVIGGTRLSGGQGGIPNTVLGLLIVGVLGNGLNLWNMPPASRWGITGAVLIVFSVLDQSRKRSRFVQETS